MRVRVRAKLKIIVGLKHSNDRFLLSNSPFHLNTKNLCIIFIRNARLHFVLRRAYDK